MDFRRVRIIKYIPLSSIFIVVMVISSCAGRQMATIQSQINSLVVADKYQVALQQLEANRQSYGANNELLYLLDYGLVLHYAGQYEESVKVLEKARQQYDQLYTVSVTRQMTTWLVNDLTAPYRGEDFERVLINIFQALNYAAMGNFEEAVVESRDVDIILQSFNDQYPLGQKNDYRADAFVHLLMGILYEALGAGSPSGRFSDLESARIEYGRASQMYYSDYAVHYLLDAPVLLKDNLLSLAERWFPDVYQRFSVQYRHMSFTNWEERLQKAEIYLIYYDGFSPVKNESYVPVPLPSGFVAKLVFPKYSKRYMGDRPGVFSAINADGKEVQTIIQVGEDIGKIAFQALENRKSRIIAKSIARSTGKYLFVKQQESVIRNAAGEDASKWFRLLSNLYNITTEQADLRSWQTLPDRILIGRLVLEPGSYDIFVDHQFLEKVTIEQGGKKFIVHKGLKLK